jgi:hypothetical protein
MTKLSKRWVWTWAIAGLAAPFALWVVGHYVPKPPDTGIFDEPPPLTAVQRRFETTSTLLFPTQFVAGFLALAVTDGGGDAGAVIPGTIILLVSLLLNSAVYAGAGFLLLRVGDTLRLIFRGQPPT